MRNWINSIVRLDEGNIPIKEVTANFRKALFQIFRDFCETTWNNIKNESNIEVAYDGLQREHAYDQWYKTVDRDNFINGLTKYVSEQLTEVANSIKTNSNVPPRLRIHKPIEIKLKLANDVNHGHGSYNSFLDEIEVFIDKDVLWGATMGALQEWVFGDGDGVVYCVNVIMPTLVHEFVHYEQWKRGLEGHRTKGYISAGGKNMWGDNFTRHQRTIYALYRLGP